MKIQAELTKKNIGIEAVRENINTADDSAAAKLFRRMLLARGAYQVESTVLDDFVLYWYIVRGDLQTAPEVIP